MNNTNIGLPLFCSEASPIIWSPGKSKIAPQDVVKILNDPKSTPNDLRELLGDTDQTIIQAKALNAIGVKLCGWKTQY